MRRKPVGTERVDLFPDYHAPPSTVSSRKEQVPAWEELFYASELCFHLFSTLNLYITEIDDFGGKILST